MATTHYSFPTINGTDTIDGVNAINGLANAVDTALYQVSQEGGDPGTNSITTAMIQNGAVTTDKLNSTVQSQITQGVNAAATANTANSTANSVKNSFEAAPVNVGSGMNGDSTAYAWGNVVSVQIAATGIPGNARTVVGHVSSAYAPTRTLTGLCMSAADPKTIGFLQVTTTGEIAVNMVSGQSTAMDPTGNLVYLCDRF